MGRIVNIKIEDLGYGGEWQTAENIVNLCRESLNSKNLLTRIENLNKDGNKGYLKVLLYNHQVFRLNTFIEATGFSFKNNVTLVDIGDTDSPIFEQGCQELSKRIIEPGIFSGADLKASTFSSFAQYPDNNYTLEEVLTKNR